MLCQPDNDGPEAEQRREMVEHQIRRRGVRDERVLEAMLQIPRELFLPPTLRDSAYDDRALPIDCGQTISQPYIVAYMTEQLSLAPECKVLEVGTGTGYQTSILATLCHRVYSIERIAALKDQAEKRLAELGKINVTFRVGDGTLGWPEEAPFDRIIVTAAAPTVPTALVDQLTEGGILVLPVGGPSEQTVVRVTRSPGRTFEIPLIGCRFVKLVGEQGWTTE